jgi:hypothetical protein
LKNLNNNIDSTLNYSITKVFDVDNSKFVPLIEAIDLGIINLDREEYIDSKTGQFISIPDAIESKKVLIEHKINNNDNESDLFLPNELNETSTLNNYDLQSGRRMAPKATIDSETSSIRSLDNEKQPPPFNLDNSFYSLTSSHVNKTKKSSFDNNKDKDSFTTMPTLISEQYSITNNQFLNNLLYKKASNGKYIRFDKMVKNKLYNRKRSQVKDLRTPNQLIDVDEALAKGLMRINDQRVIFDRDNIYIIDSVKLKSENISLADAIKKKKLINRKNCTFKYNYSIMSVGDAINDGLIDGQIIRMKDFIGMLNSYAYEIENENVINEEEHYDSSSSNEFIEAKRQQQHQRSNTVTDDKNFYIFDPSNNSYIELTMAFNKGIVRTHPLRIKYPNDFQKELNVKDAVLRGLVATRYNHGPIDFATQKASFYEHNNSCYIIDYILETVVKVNAKKKNYPKYSVEEASSRGIFLNGIYRSIKTGAHVTIDDAIERRLIIGRKIDFNNIEETFQRIIDSSSGPLKKNDKRELSLARRTSRSIDSNYAHQSGIY